MSDAPAMPTSEQQRRATYRLQLTDDFGFDAVASLAEYFAELGVSHVYLSPITEAVAGSAHGYDVTDHTAIRATFGGRQGFVAMAEKLALHDLSIIIDVVPNHAAGHPVQNSSWRTVLQEGQDAPESAMFDIDWAATHGNLLLPYLGESLADALRNGNVVVTESAGETALEVNGLPLPIRPGTEHLPLKDLVEAQNYELIEWRSPERNVRRFFSIDDLVALRPEVSLVEKMVNRIPLELGAQRLIDGVRVDHVDGMAFPDEYLRDLRRVLPTQWILVEKILAGDEHLPASWPVAGTTGYEFIRDVDQLLVDRRADSALTKLWTEVSGDDRDFDGVRRQARFEVLDGGLAPDLARVTNVAQRLLPHLDREDISAAIRHLCAGIDRYRTYSADDPAAPEVIRRAAESNGFSGDPRALSEVVAVLLDADADPEFRTRWQQLTAPTVAKGDEDRSFYRYHRLVALNEVGGEPSKFGLDIHEFHERMAWNAEHSGHSLLAGSTHDTKRSEDVRARLLVLSEVVGAWKHLVNETLASTSSAIPVVHPVDVYLALQIVVGAHPISEERLNAYLLKATREASLFTTWTDPDDDYEMALQALASLLTSHQALTKAIDSFVVEISRSGRSNSLAALVLRCMAPGVPDIYQGSEIWTDSLVDPDNRRVPSWPQLAALLAEASASDPGEIWLRSEGGSRPSEGDPGLVKLAVLQRLLRIRTRRPDCFGPGAPYQPILASGVGSDSVIAFQRGAIAVMVTRHARQMDGDWGDTEVELPAGRWRQSLVDGDPVFHEGNVRVGQLLGSLPVAVLERS